MRTNLWESFCYPNNSGREKHFFIVVSFVTFIEKKKTKSHLLSHQSQKPKSSYVLVSCYLWSSLYWTGCFHVLFLLFSGTWSAGCYTTFYSSPQDVNVSNFFSLVPFFWYSYIPLTRGNKNMENFRQSCMKTLSCFHTFPVPNVSPWTNTFYICKILLTTMHIIT